MTSLSLIVDAQGNPCSGTFGSPLATTNIAGASTGKSAGLPLGGIAPNNALTPLAADTDGALIVRGRPFLTHISTCQTQVSTGTAAGKVMISVVNGSATTWQRITGLFTVCPAQQGQSSLLNLSTGQGTYMQVPFGWYRITGHSGGTLLTPQCFDPSQDAQLDPGFTARTGATVTGRAANAGFLWDGAYNGAANISGRLDMVAQLPVLPPGWGLAVIMTQAISTAIPFFVSVTCIQSNA